MRFFSYSGSLNSQTFRILVTSSILLIGFGAAISIYLLAGETTDDPLSEFEQTKIFSYEMQRIGGKMALLSHDISVWFIGLWHGQQLAYTVAFVTLMIALLFYYFSSGIQPENKLTRPHDYNGDD